MAQILGWFSAASIRASRSKRARRSESPVIARGRTLIATSRPSFVSRARYTSPMPPAPSGAPSSYWPNRVPGWIGMTRQHSSESIPRGGSAPAPDQRIQAPLTAAISRHEQEDETEQDRWHAMVQNLSLIHN